MLLCHNTNYLKIYQITIKIKGSTLQNNTQYIQEDKIDLRELFNILKRRKKLIWSVTGLFTLLALVYVLIATPWWQVDATIEIGKKGYDKEGKAIYLESGEGVQERLQIEYIDIFKNINNRNSLIKSISVSKNNPQFVSIVALGKDNTLALNEARAVIDAVLAKHNKIIGEIVAKKQSQLDKIDRSISQLEHNKITKILEDIDYIKKIQMPSIDETIATVTADLKKSEKQRDEALKNLTSLTNDASLSALRMAQIQNLEYKISANQIKLINLNTKKQAIITTTLPAKEREMEKLKKVEMVSLQEKRKLTLLSMQPHNYHNTAIIGNIITQDKPVKPKKKLIIIIAFLAGLMISIFLAFLLEFIRSSEEEIQE